MFTARLPRGFALLVVFSAVSWGSATFTGTGSDSDGFFNAVVTFNVVCAPNCGLQIEIDNPAFTQSGNFGFGQLISDLEFQLFDGSTQLTTAGTLSSTITSDAISAPVTVVDFSSSLTNPATTATNTTPASWQFSYDNGGNDFFLNDLTGAQPNYMIIWAGPYSNLAPGFSSTHNPSLAGPVVFTVTDIPGLTALTTISNVTASFGTGPDGFASLDPCPSCCPVDDPSCGGGGGVQSVPEPLTLSLTGVGLGLAGFLRKLRAL